MSKSGALVKELLVAQRDLIALSKHQKQMMESATGFSADACAHLFGKAAAALRAHDASKRGAHG